MPKKTLAEELAELANPAPTKEFDPEADIFGSGPALEASDDELLGVAKPKGKGKEGKRMRGDIVLPASKEYSGRKSSRAAIFGSDDDAGDESEEEEEEEDGSSGSEEDDSDVEEDGSSGSEGEEEESEEEEEAPRTNGYANGFGAPSASEDDDSDGGEEKEDEAAALEREYRELQAQEADAMAGLQERAAKERRKGAAVRAQRSLWEAGLELRIMLQRALAAGNRLPRPEAHAVASAVDPELATGLEGLARDAAGALGDLLSLLDALEDNHPAVGEAAAAAGLKRKREDNDDADADVEDQNSSDALWGRLDAAYHRFAPFRDASIDRWHRKTVLSSGSAARGGLKALNQSVSAQVRALMGDAGRVVERARLPKRACRPLCAPEESEQESDDAADVEMGEGDPMAPGAAAEERDPETYDDAEFYQTLLKEFVEGKQEGGANWYSGPKQRKLVDRRASKGRKLRYHIHEKLANFMAPVELNAPQFASNIFANLFGGAGRPGSSGGRR